MEAVKLLFPEKVLLSTNRVDDAALANVGQVVRQLSPVKQNQSDEIPDEESLGRVDVAVVVA